MKKEKNMEKKSNSTMLDKIPMKRSSPLGKKENWMKSLKCSMKTESQNSQVHIRMDNLSNLWKCKMMKRLA
jgi:hypothetical protein